ncbi:LLM class flavin-dependent oxidoreductase [Brachybacterium sp. MASK1Z-5]|uniref:LLM class flavin-dependent oxidoreductase n=1 Tax=Brachybacterium halotolerans TaxID=2795215 RepID=A0ABS1BED4_9MICO|nr:LLM class flavin-dependent oxidoreductase [Brachybacterium halotolerans]MBK0332951.1 LLM class flavin-dependent oxidoreductase [Brachybacterium halotolerans]
MSKQIRFNAFDMNCVAHQSPGLWRCPGDQSWRYKDIEYWQDIARIAERGLFDAVFIADVLGTYDVFDGNDLAAIRQGAQVPVNDPVELAAVGAAVTEHVGFGITAGTAFEHPVPFARRLSTLDHLTKGRVGWNVVTGYLPSAERNLGQHDLVEHDARYDHADEYLEVIYKLLEGSWEDDAVVRDAESGVFTIPEKVHHIGHHGTFFDVPGIHLSEPSPQRTPVVFQAGASPRGVRFAAENAEAIFIGGPTKEVARSTVQRIRKALVDAGRGPYDAKIYLLSTIITDETAAGARAKHADLLSYASVEGTEVFFSGWLGVDLAGYDLDAPLGDVQSNAIQSALAAFQGDNERGETWTVRDIVRLGGIGGLGQVFVGSPSEIADTLQDIVEETEVDGFNLAYATTPGTFEDVVDLVVPELQRRGVYPQEYAPGTLRHKLLGAGDRLPANHRGAQYRVGGPLSTIDDVTGTGRPGPASGPGRATA